MKMYIIKEKHVNGKHSFETFRNKIIPNLEMANKIKSLLEEKSCEDASFMKYEIIEMEIISSEEEFYNYTEQYYIDNNYEDWYGYNR